MSAGKWSAKQYLHGCAVRRFPKAYILGNYTSIQEGLTGWFEMSVGTPMLDMSYFYSAYSFSRGKGDYRNTRLLFYRGVDQEMERELDGRGGPMTEGRECLYSVLCSESIHPENREIEALYQKGQEMGMELEDFFSCNPMNNFSVKNVSYNYLEIYIPVKTVGTAGGTE